MHMYTQVRSLRLQCQQTVKACRGIAGLIKCQKKKLSSMTSPTHKPANMNTYRHAPHRFVISLNRRHVKPPLTNDSVSFATPEQYIQRKHIHVHI